jgi:predicted metalloprotease with PDZ domain
MLPFTRAGRRRSLLAAALAAAVWVTAALAQDSPPARHPEQAVPTGAAAAAGATARTGAASLAGPPIQIALDAREAPTGVLHSHLRFPVSGSTLTLAFPQWIPGEHAPGGPLPQMVRLVFTAQGHRIAWHRDDDDIYVFHVDVPPQAREVEADLDFACLIGEEGFRSDICSSYDQLVVNWWQVVLYPTNLPNAQDPFTASIRLPAGWRYATALPLDHAGADGTVAFRTTSLETLVDSPLIAAEHLETFPLGGARSAVLDLSAQTAAALDVPPAVLGHFRRLVAEAEAMFDGPRYSQYHLLLSLGDDIDHYTLEHRESSENRLPTLGLVDPRILRTTASMIPHEYIHAWNGKYRTPRGLDIRTYQDTMRARLIWVYEGLTDYTSNILTARSGFWSEDDLTQSLAFDAAQMTYHTGRTWRPLDDTTAGVRLLFGSDAWSSARRNADLYPESGLIWLEADTIIRARSGGRRSLDDFCKAFFGAASTSKPYDFEDIVAALNGVQPYDWGTFLHTRLESTEPLPPLGGISGSGWTLRYTDERPPFIADMEASRKIDPLWPVWRRSGFIDLRSSIGLLLDEDGTVLDSAPTLAGYRARIMPGMRIIKVNDAPFSLASIEKAVGATLHGGALDLAVANGTHTEHDQLDYHDGLRWPHLVRDPTKPDMLAQIIAPRTQAR